MFVNLQHKPSGDFLFNSVLDLLRERWIGVIVKLMLLAFKETLKDFIESDEAMAHPQKRDRQISIFTTRHVFLGPAHEWLASPLGASIAIG